MRRTLFEIDEIPKDLRQYFEEVETKCGAGWKRVVEKKAIESSPVVNDDRKDLHGPTYSRHRQSIPGGQSLVGYESTTTGWTPTCICNAGDPVPCTVLDPFGGAMTTSLVSAKMGRDSVSIELNPSYCEMGRKRIAGELGMLAEIKEERA